VSILLYELDSQANARHTSSNDENICINRHGGKYAESDATRKKVREEKKYDQLITIYSIHLLLRNFDIPAIVRFRYAQMETKEDCPGSPATSEAQEEVSETRV